MSGAGALCELAAHPEVDTVMAAIVGAAGLAPCLAAARAGKRLLLANKEALVVGGALFMRAVRERRRDAAADRQRALGDLPVPAATTARPGTTRVARIVLTASGGPFRGRDPATLARVTPDEACAHPNWVMGRKISVDSATMMNKALEVIEAHFLFDLAPEQIEVVIHPQSIIHSMVVCRDQSVLAQLGTPDMRVPIAYGLGYPDRIASGAERARLAHAVGADLRAGRPAPLPRPRPGLGRVARAAGCDGGPQRRQRGGGRGVSRRNRFASIGFTASTAAPSSRSRRRRAPPTRSSRCSRSTTRRAGAPPSS